MQKQKPRGVIFMIMLFAFFLSFVILNEAYVGYRVRLFQSGQSMWEVGSTPEPCFPVLVIAQKQGDSAPVAAIVYYDKLQNYLHNATSYSFIVPRGKEAALNAELAAQQSSSEYRGDSNGIIGPGSFQVQRSREGLQYISVIARTTLGETRQFRGYYTAEANRIVPLKYDNWNDFSLRFRVGIAPMIMVVNILLWFVGWVCYRLYMWKAF